MLFGNGANLFVVGEFKNRFNHKISTSMKDPKVCLAAEMEKKQVIFYLSLLI